MTDLTPEQKLVALALLKVRVDDEIDRLKGEIEVVPGEPLTVTVPNLKHPDKPLAVGAVTRPKPTVKARVADEAAWTAWVEGSHPTQFVMRGGTPEPVASPRNAGLRMDVQKALDVTIEQRRDDAWSDSGSVFLLALFAEGWQVVPAEPAVRAVAFEFEQATLKRSEKAGEPMDANGEVPAGIEVTTVPNAVRVTKTQDAALADSFIESIGGLKAIAGSN